MRGQMTTMPPQAGMPGQVGGLGRRALIRNGLVLGAGVAMLGAGSVAMSGTARAFTIQDDWRWCIHCSGLWWAGTADNGLQPTRLGNCPYEGAGLPHTFSGTGGTNYTLESTDSPASDIQNGWRWCENCYVLFWGNGQPQNGICPVGGPHIASGSIYDMYHGSSALSRADSQGGWDWCGKCQELYWGNGDNAGGICPDGGPHTPGSATNYVMYHL
jgi:hypothetical protein